MNLQRVPHSAWIPGDYVKCTLKPLNGWSSVFGDGHGSRTAGSTCENGILVGDYERRTERITWVEEDGALLIWNSRGVLDYRQTCCSGGAVVITHWNFEVPASQVGIRGVDPEALTTAPRDLEDIQEDRRDNGTGIKLIVAFILRGVGAGATTTRRSANKPKASKVPVSGASR